MNQPAAQPNPEQLGLVVPSNIGNGEAALLVGLFAITGFTRGSDGINVGLDFRGDLPDLIDISNHIANTTDTASLVGLASLAMWRGGMRLATQDQFKHRRNRVAGATVALTLGLNALSESNLISDKFTSDPVDFVYGLFGGVLAYQLLKAKFVAPDEFDGIAAGLPPAHPARQLYDQKQQLIKPQRPVNQTSAKPPKRPANNRKHHNPHPSRKRGRR